MADDDVTAPVFTRPGAWLGGSYELALALGPRDDARLGRALEAVWSFPDLDGCFLNLDREPQDQRRIELRGAEVVPLETCLRGVARIDALAPLACSTIPVRQDRERDWLHFGIPMGSLGHVVPVGNFPFLDEGDPSWGPRVDDWLTRLARWVHERVAFELGLVGWTDGQLESAIELLQTGVPEERWCGYLVVEHGELRWYPPSARRADLDG